MKQLLIFRRGKFRLACHLITLSLFIGCSNLERNQAGVTGPETVADAAYFFDQEAVTKIQFDLSDQVMLPMEHALQSASFSRDGNSMHPPIPLQKSILRQLIGTERGNSSGFSGQQMLLRVWMEISWSLSGGSPRMPTISRPLRLT